MGFFDCDCHKNLFKIFKIIRNTIYYIYRYGSKIVEQNGENVNGTWSTPLGTSPRLPRASVPTSTAWCSPSTTPCTRGTLLTITGPQRSHPLQPWPRGLHGGWQTRRPPPSTWTRPRPWALPSHNISATEIRPRPTAACTRRWCRPHRPPRRPRRPPPRPNT